MTLTNAIANILTVLSLIVWFSVTMLWATHVYMNDGSGLQFALGFLPTCAVCFGFQAWLENKL